MGETALDPRITPGALVRHPGCPDWGLGQVQSVVGGRVTVSFPHAGQRTFDTALVALDLVQGADEGSA